MAKKRGVQGPDKTPEAAKTAADVGRGAEVDPAVHDQGHLGNAAVQARMSAGVSAVTPTMEAGLVADVARPSVQRAMLVLQLDAHDPAQTERLEQILERSNLPEKVELQSRLQDDAMMRQSVDALLDQHFGGHDADTRWAVDATLVAVAEALDGALVNDSWVDARGSVALTEATSSGSLAERSAALITELSEARASAGTRERSQGDTGRSVASLVRSLNLVVSLDEDEEEEEWAVSSIEQA
ncbi:MAG: hypothetical protein AB8H79_15560 [Myxococcota bacterium]